MAKRQVKAVLTAGQAVRASLSMSVKRLHENESGVLAGRDAEALHQARVAVRRLRSDLRSFRPLVDREWSDALRQELRWLGAEFGAVRDLDVLLQRLRNDAARAGIGAAADPGMKALMSRIRAERARVRKTLVASMHSERYERLRGQLVTATRAPRLTLAAKMSAVEALVPIVAARWKRLKSAVAALAPRPGIQALHRIRILAKRCRYAAEAAATAVGERAERFAAAAADLQDALGELNDAEMARTHLRRLRRRPEMALAAVALTAMENEAAAHARITWPDAWRAVHDKRLRAWF